MQDFHHNRARALLENAEELFNKETVDGAVTAMADTLNARFNQADSEDCLLYTSPSPRDS